MTKFDKTQNKFRFAIHLPNQGFSEDGGKTFGDMRIMCVDMAEVGMNIKRLAEDTFYTIEENMDGPFLTHEDFGRNS
tara:strand:+ start:87 stop:317 length:231 start_codon:yes stop_codon:yes gene_type:complete